MGQRQFTNYQDDILSFDLREALLGILNSGRYSGYNIMAINGTPASGNILLKLQHTGGVKKLAKNATSLSSPIGVMVTTQGTVIHEDQEVPITVTNNAAGSSIKYSLVYMEHEYTDITSGPNPASYGVINGTAGSGIPELASSYKRSIVGYIEMAIGATDITGCKWHPKPALELYGDTKLLTYLLGINSDLEFTGSDSLPADGVIGDRKYTEENYVVDNESLTDSIDLLDMFLADLQEEFDNRALDSDQWAALSDNTNQNVNSLRHGLMPKLPNDPVKFINGVGSWVSMAGMLLAANNLSDLTDKPLARANLGIDDAVKAKFFYDSGWKSMGRSVAAFSTDFDIKIRVVGSLCVIQGTFKDGTNTSPNALIATITYDDIFGANTKLKASSKIYFLCGPELESSHDANRGMFGYVEQSVADSTSLNLKVESATGLSNNGSTKFNINITFFLDEIV